MFRILAEMLADYVTITTGTREMALCGTIVVAILFCLFAAKSLFGILLSAGCLVLAGVYIYFRFMRK